VLEEKEGAPWSQEGGGGGGVQPPGRPPRGGGGGGGPTLEIVRSSCFRPGTPVDGGSEPKGTAREERKGGRVVDEYSRMERTGRGGGGRGPGNPYRAEGAGACTGDGGGGWENPGPVPGGAGTDGFGRRPPPPPPFRWAPFRGFDPRHVRHLPETAMSTFLLGSNCSRANGALIPRSTQGRVGVFLHDNKHTNAIYWPSLLQTRSRSRVTHDGAICCQTLFGQCCALGVAGETPCQGLQGSRHEPGTGPEQSRNIPIGG